MASPMAVTGWLNPPPDSMLKLNEQATLKRHSIANAMGPEWQPMAALHDAADWGDVKRKSTSHSIHMAIQKPCRPPN